MRQIRSTIELDRIAIFRRCPIGKDLVQVGGEFGLLIIPGRHINMRFNHIPLWRESSSWIAFRCTRSAPFGIVPSLL